MVYVFGVQHGAARAVFEGLLFDSGKDTYGNSRKVSRTIKANLPTSQVRRAAATASKRTNIPTYIVPAEWSSKLGARRWVKHLGLTVIQPPSNIIAINPVLDNQTPTISTLTKLELDPQMKSKNKLAEATKPVHTGAAVEIGRRGLFLQSWKPARKTTKSPNSSPADAVIAAACVLGSKLEQGMQTRSTENLETNKEPSTDLASCTGSAGVSQNNDRGSSLTSEHLMFTRPYCNSEHVFGITELITTTSTG